MYSTERNRERQMVPKFQNRLRNSMLKKQALLERAVTRQEENQHYLDVVQGLDKLKLETGMPIVQENGQRTYGPPKDWIGPPPPKGCEIFVGRLPRSVFEPHLVPLFEKFGPIYALRLMMDFSGENRGFCFVQYTKAVHAERAIKEMNNYEIRKGRRIGVVKSMDNCCLFVGPIPIDKMEEDILLEMKKITDGVKRVTIRPPLPDEDNTENTRVFAFVEYENHKLAAMARRKMIPGKITMWGLDVNVDWAKPEQYVCDT